MKVQSKKHILNVVPLTKISLSHEPSFFYSFSKTLPVGSLVKMEFFRRKIEGIVLSAASKATKVKNEAQRN